MLPTNTILFFLGSPFVTQGIATPPILSPPPINTFPSIAQDNTGAARTLNPWCTELGEAPLQKEPCSLTPSATCKDDPVCSVGNPNAQPCTYSYTGQGQRRDYKEILLYVMDVILLSAKVQAALPGDAKSTRILGSHGRDKLEGHYPALQSATGYQAKGKTEGFGYAYAMPRPHMSIGLPSSL